MVENNRLSPSLPTLEEVGVEGEEPGVERGSVAEVTVGTVWLGERLSSRLTLEEVGVEGDATRVERGPVGEVALGVGTLGVLSGTVSWVPVGVTSEGEAGISDSKGAGAGVVVGEG